MPDSATTLQCLADRARQLGSLPAVAAKVLELTERPQVDVRALKQCIEHDPALTAKILRIVNSSLFGFSREVSHLNQALALLGIQPLKLLVLGFSLPPGLYQSVTRDRLAWYWRHALTKAVAARELAEAVWSIPGDEPFLAGLLQDLGLLVMLQELGAPLAKLVEKAEAGDVDLLCVQRQTLGFDHTALSARILADWRLPESIVAAVDWAGLEPVLEVLPQPQRTLPQVVRLAELLAQVLTQGKASALEEFYRLAERWRQFDAAQLESLVSGVQAKVAQLAEVLALDLPPETDYNQLLLRAQQQLAEVAAAVVENLLRSERTAQPRPCDSATVAASLLQEEIHTLGTAVADVAKHLQKRASHPHRPAATATSSPSPAASQPAATATAPPPMPTGTCVADSGEATLPEVLAVALGNCRGWRCPLSLLLVAPLCGEGGVPAGPVQGRLVQDLARKRCGDEWPDAVVTPYRDHTLAIVLPGNDRTAAVHFGQEMIAGVRQWAAAAPGEGSRVLSVAVGIATLSHVPPRFPLHELVDGADRCLHASRASGGGVVKSIEIY